MLGGTNVSATNSSPIWLLDSVIGYEGQARLVATHRLTFYSSHTVLLLRLIAESTFKSLKNGIAKKGNIYDLRENLLDDSN